MAKVWLVSIFYGLAFSQMTFFQNTVNGIVREIGILSIGITLKRTNSTSFPFPFSFICFIFYMLSYKHVCVACTYMFISSDIYSMLRRCAGYKRLKNTAFYSLYLTYVLYSTLYTGYNVLYICSVLNIDAKDDVAMGT